MGIFVLKSPYTDGKHSIFAVRDGVIYDTGRSINSEWGGHDISEFDFTYDMFEAQLNFSIIKVLGLNELLRIFIVELV